MLKKVLNYIKNASTCGVLVPPPTVRATKMFHAFARFVAFIQVGKIRIKGLETLRNLPAPYIVASNHPHYADAAIIPLMINAPARYMMAREVFEFAGGLGALIGGPSGAFAVDIDQGQGAPAFRAAIRVLTSNQRLVIFPEGWAHLDGKMRLFKKGAVCIAKQAAHQLKHAVNIVPVFLRYDRYPGSWITKLNPRLQYFVAFLCFWRYRRGVTVVIGNPISSGTLPTCNNEATTMLQNAIIDLDPKKFSTPEFRQTFRSLLLL
jgi:1-acyl-sn-glycerol-3-phosphate acyltransferase